MAKPSRAVALEDAIAAIEAIAPPALAEPWDNVGLVLEPASPRRVERALVCVDFTEAVLDEAVDADCALVFAYHPPLFEPLKKLVRRDPRSRLVLRAIEAEVAVYSPHTAIDAAPGGVNDWLADAFGAGMRRAIARPLARMLVGQDETIPPVVGQGRFVALDRPAPVARLERRLASHLGLKRLRVAIHERHRRGEPVRTVGLCAGAGGDVVLESGADLLVTGELSHHKTLAALARGSSVLLSEHSATERGYLPRLARALQRALGIPILASRADAGPIVWT